MTERSYGAEYYVALQQRLRNLLAALEHRLPLDDRRLVAELVEANEVGLALRTIDDALVEEAIPVDAAVATEMVDLAGEMGFSIEVTDRFRVTPVG